MRLSTATSAVDEPEMPAKNMLNSGDDLREAAAEMADQRLGERDHAVGDVCRRHQLADEQEERHREQRLRVDAVEELADDRAAG